LVPDSREKGRREKFGGVCFRERKGLLEREMVWLCDDLAAAALSFSRVQRAAQDRCVLLKGESTDRVPREPFKTKQIAGGRAAHSVFARFDMPEPANFWSPGPGYEPASSARIN
jgi:hypothetical protein